MWVILSVGVGLGSWDRGRVWGEFKERRGDCGIMIILSFRKGMSL